MGAHPFLRRVFVLLVGLATPLSAVSNDVCGGFSAPVGSLTMDDLDNEVVGEPYDFLAAGSAIGDLNGDGPRAAKRNGAQRLRESEPFQALLENCRHVVAQNQ